MKFNWKVLVYLTIGLSTLVLVYVLYNTSTRSLGLVFLPDVAAYAQKPPYNFKSFEKTKEMEKDGYLYFDVDLHRKHMNSRNITKIVHQSWKNKEIPDFAKRYISSWKSCFPDWVHKYWTDEDNRNLIKRHYPWFLAKYDSFPNSIYKADSVRYVYMLHYGGIYTDIDNECLYPFEHLLFNHSLVFGDIDHVPRVTPLKENYVQNSFMYSQPNHPFWAELLVKIVDTAVTNTADIITGPVILSNLIHNYRIRYPKTHSIKVYEGRYFNPMTWGVQSRNPKFCKIWNGMNEEEYKKCHDFYFKKGSYMVQYHSHVWG